MNLARSTTCFLVTAAGLGLAACGSGGSSSSGGGSSANAPTTVKIAAEGPFTGDQASLGAGALQAIQLAVKDFNKAGGVNGTQVQLLTWDDQHSAQVAQTLQAQGTADPTVLGIVGPVNSGVVLGTAPSLQSANPPLPFISESASNVKVTDSSWAVAHRVCARDDQQGPADARFMIDQGAKGVYLMDAKSDYSIALADETEQYLKVHNIPTTRDSVTPGQTDFGTIISNIKRSGADWVYFADEGPEAAPLVTEMKQQSLIIGQNIQFMGTDGEEDPSIITKSQGAFDGAYATNITADPAGVSSAAATNYVTEFKTAYGADSLAKAGPYYGSGYEAAQVMLQAIKDSPVKNGKISRADVNSRLASGTFSTIFGAVKFNSKGDIEGGGIFVFQAKGDQMTVLKQVTG
ncbi:MAG: branched-chain amino acid ABC transporter substrate-binding protein [Candidatus Dormibacteraeota bacterium]|uniref:Branched-chain amino acid ABC transporter substrate-binding protein n=1 Tax=Candidatus Aeolococcus gillhamiae TaxID=3127015 RepID=A0A934N914_9BACT|nr:branched-chain amino acid ABC transporter substrate-binding protein [Candidatus Dormibacteraeota bacterium]